MSWPDDTGGYEHYEYEDTGEEMEDIRPEMFEGDAGQKTINYIISCYKRQELMKKRQKGKPPSSEDPAHYGPASKRPRMRPPPEDSYDKDPNYSPTADMADMADIEQVVKKGYSVKGRGRGLQRGNGRGAGRGRGRGSNPDIAIHGLGEPHTPETGHTAPRSRGRAHTPRAGQRGRGQTPTRVRVRGQATSRGQGNVRAPTGGRAQSRGRVRGARGRGRGASSSQEVAALNQSNESSKGMHWRKPEIKALIDACNHLKPVLKGRFKHSTDGVAMKRLAWTEVKDYVNAIGGLDRSEKQCQDKIGYYCQKSKRKRQEIDSKYTTGSGVRDDEDYLDELEQGACDYAGEEVTLGIPGMQPADVKGGGRPDQAWSCYDPERADRPDYATLKMPSEIMAKVVEGDLLESVGGEAVMEAVAVQDAGAFNYEDHGQYDNPEDEIADDIEEEGAYYYQDDVEAQYEGEDYEEDVTSTSSKTDIPHSVTSVDMLKICNNFNANLKKATDRKGPAQRRGNAANVLLCTDSSQKTKQSLLHTALQELDKAEASTLPKNAIAESTAVPSVSSQVSTSRKVTSDRQPQGVTTAPARKKLNRPPSFSKLVNQSLELLGTPEDSPDPPHININPRTYTEEEVQYLLKAALHTKSTSTKFATSTPERAKEATCGMSYQKPNQQAPHREPSPIAEVPPKNRMPEEKTSSVPITANTSAIDEIKVNTSLSRKKLFTSEAIGSNKTLGNDSLLTIPPHSPLVGSLNQSIQDQIMRSNLNTAARQILDDHKEIIREAQEKIQKTFCETQDKIATSTKAMCDTVVKGQDQMSTCSSKVVGSVVKNIESLGDAVRTSQQTVSTSTKKMSDDVVKGQEQLSTCYTKVSDSVSKSCASLADAMNSTQQTVSASTKKMSEDVVKGQEQLSTCYTRVSDSVSKSCGSLADALKSTQQTVSASNLDMAKSVKAAQLLIESSTAEHAATLMDTQSKMSTCTVQFADSVIAVQGKLVDVSKDQAERFEESAEAITTAHERIVECIVRKQIKLVQGLEHVVGEVQGTCKKLSQSMTHMVDANATLTQSQENSIKTMETASRALDKIVQTLERFVDVQERMYQQLAAAPVIQVPDAVPQQIHRQPPVTTTADNPTSNPKPGMSSVPDYMVPDPVVQSVHEENVQQLPDDNTTAYLTHPETDNGAETPTYQAESQLDRLSGTFVTYALPGSSINKECAEAVNTGLPQFTVIGQENFVIIQDPGRNEVDSERPLEDAVSNGQVSEAETEGSVSDRGELNDDNQQTRRTRSSRRGPKIRS